MLLTVSPTARYALATPIALGRQGDLRAPQGLAEGAAVDGELDVTWESESTVVFTVHRPTGDQDASTGLRPIESLLVRCRADTRECELASPLLTTPLTGLVQLP